MHRVTLYIAGESSSSARALASLEQVCRQRLQNGYELEVVDILQHPGRAIDAGVVATPTLIRESPLPRRAIIDPLANRELLARVLDATEPQRQVASRARPTAANRPATGHRRSTAMFAYDFAASALKPTPGGTDGDSSRGLKRILVIDDFEGIHRSFRYALENAPVEVLVAEDGEAGLDMLEQNGAELVYLDLRMPGITGIETLRRLRAKHPELPVFILTAFADDFCAQLRQATLDGLDFELLRKPLEMEEIYLVSGVATGGFGPYQGSVRREAYR